VLAIIALLSSGVRFTIGPFLKPVTADLGLDYLYYAVIGSLGLAATGHVMGR
jgi:hypothetical protein